MMEFSHKKFFAKGNRKLHNLCDQYNYQDYICSQTLQRLKSARGTNLFFC